MANHNKQLSPPEQPPIQLIEKFIDNQSKELSLRSQEIGLQAQQEKNSFEFSREALKAQAEDRREQRTFMLTQRKHTFWFMGFVFALIFSLIGYALHKGDTAFATEIVKAIIYLAGGGLGGYGYAKTKTKEPPTRTKEA
jgi:hypothetical protein